MRVAIDRVLLGFAAVVVTLAAVGGAEAAPGTDPRNLDALAVAILALAALVLIASRRFPATGALVVLGITFGWYGLGYTSGLINVANLVAFYVLGASENQGRKVAVVVASVLLTVSVMVGVGDEEVRSALEASGYVVMAVLFGEVIRNRRLVIEQYSQRALQAEAESERKVVEERMRIARDVHDVLAHTVAVMTVQAGVASDAIDRDRAQAGEALDAIRHAGREAMEEIQATVAVLRSGSGPAGTAPVPRIDRLGELVDATRDQGLEVDVELELSGAALPELVELTAYRLVQEALTNVVRHARASAVDVSIRESPSELSVEIRDDGPGDEQPVITGYGLRGMAERVESIGGTLRHGRENGGWLVRASLPIPGRVSETAGPR